MKRFRVINDLSTEFDPIEDQVRYEADTVNYVQELTNVVRFPPPNQGGVDLAAMEKDFRILKVLKSAKPGDVVELEDADWENLCNKIRATKWLRVDERIIRLCHTVLNATEDVVT